MRAAILLTLLVGAYGLPMFRFRRGMSGTPFVINGDDADVGEWPWQCAEMIFGDSFNCGCSILDENHILIAAHCTDGWAPSQVEFLVGAHDIYSQNEGNPRNVASVELALHPDYDYDPFGVPRFDVSVAHVETITFDDFTAPVPARAPSGAGDVFVGQECYITGWGDTTAGGGQLPDVLQEAQIQVLALADCQERYSSTPYQVYDESICVFKLMDTDDHTGSCYGDSGGPLVCRTSADADWTQAGLTSWGYPPCGVDGSADGLPSVYMATGDPDHYDFIEQELATVY